MSRLNKVIRQKEKALDKRNAPVRSREIPTYSTSGRPIHHEKKKKKKSAHQYVTMAVVILFFGLIYIPQFFMADEMVSSDNSEIKIDGSAITLNNLALKNNPTKDFDGDGIDNSEETTKKTNPWEIDSDGDGLTDFCELYVTKTDQTKYDEDYLVSKQKELDEKKGKAVKSPYKIGNVILWADDYESKAYGSVVKTISGYRFCNFNGYAQFPDSDGKYAYKVENGVRIPLSYRKEENAWRVSSGDTIEVYDNELETTVEFSFFGNKFYVSDNFATSLLSKILPNKGFITSMTKTKMDVEPDTRKSVIIDIAKPDFDEDDTERFESNSKSLNDLQYLRETIKTDGSCVGVSLFNSEKGEYLAIAYGYTYEGDILLADMKTLKPVGVLGIEECSQKIMNEDGNIVTYSYFDFEGFGFDSKNGDRISFFTASSSEPSNNLGNDSSQGTEDSDTGEENQRESSTEQNNDSEGASETEEGAETSSVSSQAKVTKNQNRTEYDWTSQ